MASIWSWLEPTLVLFQLIFRLRFIYHSKFAENQIDPELGRCFTGIIDHLNQFGVANVFPAEKEMYLRHVKSDLIKQREFYRFLDGEIHYRFLKKAILPNEQRVDKFLVLAFFFIKGYKRFFKYLLFKERLRLLFRRRDSFLHYLSIPSWRIKTYTELVDEVQNIGKVDPLWNQRYLVPKGEDIKKSKPTIGMAIDRVLSKGIITERSIFNLATSEKLVFVHKYAEGFSQTWKQQDNERQRLKAEKERWTKSKAKNAHKELQKINESIAELNRNWLVAPVRHALESLGFQRLFNNLEGVYVLPLSLLPEEYHKEPEHYIKDKVITSAQEYLESIDVGAFNYIDDVNESLKYLILVHVVPVSHLKIISKERNIEISSPELSRMLFSTFLASDSSNLSNMYINDVVRNVDFKSQLKDNKTGNYIITNLNFIQNYLWNRHSVDIYKPQTLSLLTENHINDLCNTLIDHDQSIKKYLLRNQLIEIVDFYKRLNTELNELKQK